MFAIRQRQSAFRRLRAIHEPWLEELSYASRQHEASWPLRAVSWNIHLGKRYAAIEEAFAHHPVLRDAGVIALQEAGRLRRRGPSHAALLARRHGLNAVYAGAHRCGVARERGQAILTPYPIERSWRVSLPWVRHHRIALVADLLVGSERMRVVNLHLENRGRISPFIFQERAAQVAHVLESLRHEPPARTMLLGDFNTLGYIVDRGRAEAPLHQLLEREGFQNAHAGLWRSTHTPFRYQLDWIFSKDLPLLAGDVADTGRLSDHRPVWAEFAAPATVL